MDQKKELMTFFGQIFDTNPIWHLNNYSMPHILSINCNIFSRSDIDILCKI